MDRDWAVEEVEAIVRDYFEMLTKEMRGQHYVKAHHRRALLPLLDRRSEGSVEMKHCNISAVLRDLDLPYIDGYKPRPNLQQLLSDRVTEEARRRGLLDDSGRPVSRR
jgi:hypothetical protein